MTIEVARELESKPACLVFVEATDSRIFLMRPIAKIVHQCGGLCLHLLGNGEQRLAFPSHKFCSAACLCTNRMRFT
jgi:hypothetical protein